MFESNHAPLARGYMLRKLTIIGLILTAVIGYEPVTAQVTVRGHYRKGSYVRSHTRRSPVRRSSGYWFSGEHTRLKIPVWKPEYIKVPDTRLCDNAQPLGTDLIPNDYGCR